MQKTVKDVNDRINDLNLEKHSLLLASINHYQQEFDSKIKKIEKRIVDLESIPILDIENKLFFDVIEPRIEIKQETIENIAQKCVNVAFKITIVFDYINYKCIKSKRFAIPITSYMGSNEYHRFELGEEAISKDPEYNRCYISYYNNCYMNKSRAKQ